MREARRWQRPYAHRELWVVAAVILLVGGVLVTPVLDDEMPRVEAAVIIAIALGLATRVVHTGLLSPTARSWAHSRTRSSSLPCGIASPKPDLDRTCESAPGACPRGAFSY